MDTSVYSSGCLMAKVRTIRTSPGLVIARSELNIETKYWYRRYKLHFYLESNRLATLTDIKIIRLSPGAMCPVTYCLAVAQRSCLCGPAHGSCPCGPASNRPLRPIGTDVRIYYRLLRWSVRSCQVVLLYLSVYGSIAAYVATHHDERCVQP